MIRKSAKRFSEKIMLKQETNARCRSNPISSRFEASDAARRNRPRCVPIYFRKSPASASLVSSETGSR
jgi:hypothetical protein